MKTFKEFLEEGKKTNKLLFFRNSITDIDNKLKGKTIVVFDTETSGLQVSLPWVQVTEVAAISYDYDSGNELNRLHYKVELTPETIREIELEKAHGGPRSEKGITIEKIFSMTKHWEDDAERKPLAEVYQKFADFINDHNNPILVAQNAGFDMAHMFAPMKKLGIQKPKFQEVIDTMVLSKSFLLPALYAAKQIMDETSEIERMINSLKNEKGRVAVRLGNLGNAFNVKPDHWHSGISDAKQTAEIFIKMMKFLRDVAAKGVEDHPSFRKWHKVFSGRAFSFGKQPAGMMANKRDKLIRKWD